MCVCRYIYIYIEREREREREIDLTGQGDGGEGVIEHAQQGDARQRRHHRLKSSFIINFLFITLTCNVKPGMV